MLLDVFLLAIKIKSDNAVECIIQWPTLCTGYSLTFFFHGSQQYELFTKYIYTQQYVAFFATPSQVLHCAELV